MATAICSHCGQPTSSEAALCAHCGLKVEQRKRREFETPVVCPACRRATEFVWLASIQVDVCPACKGVWFDKGELVELPQRLTDKELADAAAEMLGRFPKPARFFRRPAYLQCPVCAGHMTRNNYREVSGILTDRCPSCGTWVDQPSITRILRLIAGGNLAEIDERAARREPTRPPVDPVIDRTDWRSAFQAPLSPADSPQSRRADLAISVVWFLIDILGGIFAP